MSFKQQLTILATPMWGDGGEMTPDECADYAQDVLFRHGQTLRV